MNQTFRTVLGIGLLIMAVIGSLLPILQGWMFFAAAIGVLGTDHPISRWCLNQLRRFEWARRALDKLGIGKKKEDYPPGGPL